MQDLRLDQIVQKSLRICNREAEVLTVWLEPWAERYELASEESLDVVFIGPDKGIPEVVPRPGEVVIYGWEGSEFFAFRGDRLDERESTVGEIVRQEFKIAKEHPTKEDTPWPDETFEHMNWKLEFDESLTHESQETACKAASYLICELAPKLDRSDAVANLLWQIARRVVRIKGLALADPNIEAKKAAIWSDDMDKLGRLIEENAVSVVPVRFDAKFPIPPRSKIKRPTS